MIKYYQQNLRNLLNVWGAKPHEQTWIHNISSSAVAVPQEFSLAVWNTFKGLGHKNFQNDLSSVLEKHEFICIQEALLCDQQKWQQNLLNSNYVFASSYVRRDGLYEGLLTLTPQLTPHLMPQRLVSPHVEPIVKTPKISLVSSYDLGSQQDFLVVVNVHTTLFRSIEKFKAEIHNIFNLLNEHSGPSVICGDFNTFAPVYTKKMFECAHHFGYHNVQFRNDTRNIVKRLDHVFIKNLKVLDAYIVTEIKSSDHPLLSVQLSY